MSTCEECRREFNPGKTKGVTAKKTCSAYCDKERRRKKQLALRRSRVSMGVCENCGIELISHWPFRKTCSRSCSLELDHKKRTERMRIWQITHRERVAARKRACNAKNRRLALLGKKIINLSNQRSEP